MIKVTIWNEFIHERELPEIAAVYPDGIHKCIGRFLETDKEMAIKYATLDMVENGLSEDVLNNTDVLIWWGHAAHEKVSDDVVERVKQHVLMGMGFIALHSAHFCKVLKTLLGTSMTLRWHEGDREKLICVNPSHPIAEGVAESFVLEKEEMYGEYFDIPKPDDVVFMGWFASGEVFRSACTFTRGRGKIFYFQPGHEEYPTYKNKEIQKIITNGVHYVRPINKKSSPYDCIQTKWE